MQNEKKSSEEKLPTDDAAAGYNPKNRDFDRKEGDVDRVSESEKKSLEEDKKNEQKK